MRKKVGERVSTKLFCATSRCGYKGFHGTAARRLLARGACVVGRKVAALPPISLSFTPSGLALQDDPLQAWLSGTTVARRVGRKHMRASCGSRACSGISLMDFVSPTAARSGAYHGYRARLQLQQSCDRHGETCGHVLTRLCIVGSAMSGRANSFR